MDPKVNKKSLSNFVYRDIKDKILTNEIFPGDKLIEMEIAAELGVSRTPVREALKKLEEDGLVNNYPRKSYVVSKISMKEARNLYVVRKSLEPLAVEMLAEKGLNKRTKLFEEVNEKLQKAMNGEEESVMEQLIIQWNVELVNSLDNEILRELMTTVNNRLYRFSNFIFRDKGNYKKHYNNLSKIFELIKEKKSKEARLASENTIEEIYSMFEQQVDYKMFKN